MSGNKVNAVLVNNESNAKNMVFVAAMYGEQTEMMNAKLSDVQLPAAGGTVKVSVTFDFAIDSAKHTIKLFAWRDLETKEPLSFVVTIPPGAGGLQESTEVYADPLAFYAGKVVRSFSPSENKTLSLDLTKYIDHDRKMIKSVTGELEWDYGKGVNEMNAPKAQGVTGLLNKQDQYDLDNVVIASNNEFGTVVVVSMDGLPIAESRRLMIQAMTEDKPYGFKSEKEIDKGKETGNLKITDIGSGPMNVKNIDTTVTLKGMTDVTKVYTLNENGYVAGELTGSATAAGYNIQLAPNAIYTIVEREGLANPYTASGDEQTVLEPTYVWWEGEDFTETNFPWETSSFAASTFPETRNLLAGKDQEWLSISAAPANGETPYAKYTINVPEDGTYNFFTRKFWQHGPYFWRFDDASEWQYVNDHPALLDKTVFRTNLEANWINVGKVELTAGEHTFELKLDSVREDGTYVAAFDSFMLIKESFIPKGKLKPGEKWNLAEEGFWSFEPDMDPFSESAIVDLRGLNEEVAGQSGHIRREGDKLVLGNGEEARFWGVNTGSEVTNLEHGDIDYMAARLAKNGVNLVRLHASIFGDDGKLSDQALDNYQYFISAMKKEGIYVSLSYYFVLWFNDSPFTKLQFDADQQTMYKEAVKKFLLTPNPYDDDNLPLGQDPAVALIEIQNEDSYLFWTFNPEDIYSPDQLRAFYRLFGEWATAKYGSIAAAYTAWGEGSQDPADLPDAGELKVEAIYSLSYEEQTKRRADTLQFLVENQREFYAGMKSFLENDIGTESLISASNWVTANPQKLEALERYTYDVADVIDRHAYFDSHHDTTEQWHLRPGDKYNPEPVVLHPDQNPVKIVHNADHPSMISETTWTNPTPYGAEGPFMYAAYGALQGIDMLALFSSKGPGWSTNWEKWPVMSPTMMGQFPAFAMIYRLGYVTEAPVVVQESRTLESLYHHGGSAIFESLNLDDIRK
ncbi:hypothetical protein [Paenibacillus silvisoli]|uniref:hypothetical protein n=1 Tax=Paenibacillus silvisoli TaxID=3110539 RepID=UPI00280521A0|nr:hypothetical protein [Paenibacillus silvisoli]